MLYKARWTIELFLCRIKGHLRTKHWYGTLHRTFMNSDSNQLNLF
jgi:IS4 transposase